MTQTNQRKRDDLTIFFDKEVSDAPQGAPGSEKEGPRGNVPEKGLSDRAGCTARKLRKGSLVSSSQGNIPWGILESAQKGTEQKGPRGDAPGKTPCLLHPGQRNPKRQGGKGNIDTLTCAWAGGVAKRLQ